MQLTRFMPLVFAALLGGLIWVLNRAADLPDDQRVPSPKLPDMVVENPQVRRFNTQGELVTYLTATQAQHILQDDTMLFENVRLEQSVQGEPARTVMGEHAKSIHRGNEMWWTGKVEMRRAPFANNPELVIRTRDVHVDTEKQVARSDAPMTAEMGANHARAVGFVVDNRNETLELISQVSMTYVPNKTTGRADSRLLP